MTSRSLGDDSSTARTTNADVAQHDREPERVGSDGFVDSILSMAEHRAEAGDESPVASAAEPATAAVAEPPVAARVVSDDFIDAVLEVAEARAASAVAAAELKPEPAAATQPDSVTSRDAPEPATRLTSMPTAARPPTAIRTPPPVAMRDERAVDLDDAALVFTHDVDTDHDLTHVHPTRPTPWWRKRPSLEVVFAAIATVLMVVGLALVVSELF